jgi:putative ABC transport system permease protein
MIGAPLDRKLLRDLWHLRGSVAAIAIVVACGVASFVALRSMVYHLGDAQAAYYADARFADVFARVRRAPMAVAQAVAAVPGVAAVTVRASTDVVLDVPGLAEPATGHVVGVAAGGEPASNRVVLVRGEPLAAGRPDHVLVSEGFSTANALAPGDSLGVALNGRWRRLRVAGIALSPEFAFEMKPGDLLPDNRRYGVLWMEERALAAAFGMEGAWNDLAVRLEPGASEAAVIAALDRLLAPYGTYGAYGRDLQPSHRFLSDEIEQNRTFAAVMPVIFLGVAAFLLHLVLARIVATQREQVGMLKAFGVPPVLLARHYVLFALVPVLLGSVLGSALGLWAAQWLASVYADYFRVPAVRFVPHVSVLATAAAISVVAAVVGALNALQRVLRLPAAEAMRAEPPVRYEHGTLERVGRTLGLPPGGRMALRSVARRPGRAALSVLAMAFGVATVIVGNFGFDSMRVLRNVQFRDVMREDVTVVFDAPRGTDALREVARLPGVLRAEPLRSAVVRLRHEQRSRQVALVGIEPDAQLRRVVDGTGRAVPLPAHGLLLSRALADLLHAGIGDSVRVEFLAGERPVRAVPVGGLLDDLVGTTAYAPADVLLRMQGLADAVDGAALRVEPAWRDSVYARLKRTPGVQGVTARDAVLESFDRQLAAGFNVTFITLLLFAAALAAGVVYNTARIALSERGRDLASLRVLGFTRGEVAAMLFGEQGMLALVAVPAGFAVGYLFATIMVDGLASELFRFPLVISVRTYLLSSAVLAGAWGLSAALVRRRLDPLDLVAVLKTRE